MQMAEHMAKEAEKKSKAEKDEEAFLNQDKEAEPRQQQGQADAPSSR